MTYFINLAFINNVRKKLHELNKKYNEINISLTCI